VQCNYTVKLISVESSLAPLLPFSPSSLYSISSSIFVFLLQPSPPPSFFHFPSSMFFYPRPRRPPRRLRHIWDAVSCTSPIESGEITIEYNTYQRYITHRNCSMHLETNSLPVDLSVHRSACSLFVFVSVCLSIPVSLKICL
jgi:hypothetical protein